MCLFLFAANIVMLPSLVFLLMLYRLIPPFCNLAAKLPKALVVSEDVSLPFSDLAFFPLFVHIPWAMFS